MKNGICDPMAIRLELIIELKNHVTTRVSFRVLLISQSAFSLQFNAVLVSATETRRQII
jgi:hypothetical protein